MELAHIRQNVFKHLIKKSNKIDIDECISLIIAEILGYFDKGNINQYDSWGSLCLKLSNYKNLNKNALLEKIKDEIITVLTLDEKYNLLGSKIIYSFNEDILIFTEDYISKVKNQSYTLRNNYGEQEYKKRILKESLNKKSDRIKLIRGKEEKKYFLCPEEIELNEYWNRFETADRNILFPFWKWKISNSEYKELEAKLTALIDKYGQNDVVCRHAFKLGLYYSEWYKREYNGNNTIPNQIIKSGNEKSNIIRIIWDNIDDKFSKYKYGTERSERRDESLQLLGGLPLKYITSQEKNSVLSREFASIFQDLNSNKLLNFEDLSTGNQTINKSAQDGGSIFEFINELKNGNFPFAEEDMNDSPFKEFKSFVEEGIKNYLEELKKKFRVDWFVEQHPTYQYIYPYLLVNMKHGDDSEGHRFISKDRLEKWGLSVDFTCFGIKVQLMLQGDQKVDLPINYFNLCGNGKKFISRNGSSWKISLSDLANKPKSISFILVAEGVERTIQTEEIPRYIQLWNIGFGQWQSRAKNGKKSAVLLLSNETTTKDTALINELITKNKSNKYRWAIINKELTIIDKGKDRKLFAIDGDIEVMPKNTRPFSNAINYNGDGLVEFCQGENEKSVYLLKGKVDFSVRRIPKSKYRKNDRVEEINEFKIEYFSQKENCYVEFKNTDSLSQGYIRFRVSYEPYSKIVESYWLPENAVIKRDVHSKKMIFKNINCIEFLENQFIDKDDRLNENYCIVKLVDNDAYLELEIYRPLKRKDLFIKREFHGSMDIIPIYFADKFQLRVFDENGLKFFRLSEEVDELNMLRVTFNNNNQIEDSTGVERDLIKIVTYTKNLETSHNGTYNLVNSINKAIDEFKHYNFYFLPLDNTNESKKIDLKHVEKNSGNYVGFQIHEKTDGIIFQSLKTEIFQETYRPIFYSKAGGNIHSSLKKEERSSRILKYKENIDDKLFEMAVKQFNIATEHKLYFGMFDVFWALHDDSTLLAKFYLKYCDKMQSSNINYSELQRFAQEFLFDWMLIPRKVWLEVIGFKNQRDKKEQITNLLKNKKLNDGSEEYKRNQSMEIYWSSNHSNNNQTNDYYKNIKRLKKLNSYFKSKTDEKIKLLKSIDDDNNIYSDLFEKLQN